MTRSYEGDKLGTTIGFYYDLLALNVSLLGEGDN